MSNDSNPVIHFDIRVMLERILESIRPRFKDDDYYVRLVTGLMAIAFFFAAGSFVAGKELSQYSGFVRQSGNIFYYRSVNEVAGSAGQQLVSAVLAFATFLGAAVTAARRFRFGFIAGTKTFFTILVITMVLFGWFGGFIGNGVIQLFILGYLNLRMLWWILMPIVYVGGLYGAWFYAKEGAGTVMDMPS